MAASTFVIDELSTCDLKLRRDSREPTYCNCDETVVIAESTLESAEAILAVVRPVRPQRRRINRCRYAYRKSVSTICANLEIAVEAAVGSVTLEELLSIELRLADSLVNFTHVVIDLRNNRLKFVGTQSGVSCLGNQRFHVDQYIVDCLKSTFSRRENALRIANVRQAWLNPA